MIFRSTLMALLLTAALARAGGEERRVFSVFIDKRPAGNHEMVIETLEDGVQVTSDANVRLKVLLVSYKYTFHGTETWKNDRLIQLSTAANDDGKTHAVAAEMGADGLAMKADGKDVLVKDYCWTTTYWKLPPEKRRGPGILLLDADTGKLIQAKMEKVGVEKINVLGKAVDCSHYKLTGGVQVDLWYDGDDRMIRQEAIEDGHRTLLELARLQRD